MNSWCSRSESLSSLGSDLRSLLMSRPSFTSSMNHLGALALQNNWKIQILWLSDKQAGHSCWLCYPLTVNEILPYICTATALSFGSYTSKKFWNFMFAKPRIYVCICVATWVKCACQPMIWTIAVNVFAQFERLFFFFFFFFVNVPTWTLNRHCEKGLKYFRLSPILFVLVSLKCTLVAAS